MIANFFESYQILTAIVPKEIVIIILAGVVISIRELFKEKENGTEK